MKPVEGYENNCPKCKKKIELDTLQKLKELGYGKMVKQNNVKSIGGLEWEVFVPLDIEAVRDELK